MMQNQPKVSVIMPSLNVVEYIRECMESVIQQTLQEIEIICVDAGSTDGTLEILREYEKKDQRVKVLISPKRSYGYQMNMGMDAATGEYMGIVETDDYILPNMYEDLYDVAHKNDLDFVKSDFARFCFSIDDLSELAQLSYKMNYNGQYIKPEPLFKKQENYNTILNPQEDVTLFKAALNIWSGIYNMEFLSKFDIRFNETAGASFQDNGFYFQTFSCASKILFCNQVYYMNRRDNPNSSVHDRAKVYCMNEEYEFILAFLEKHPEKRKQFIGIYCYKKYENYEFTYNRIDLQYKLGYIVRWSEAFQKHFEDGDIDFSLFEERRRKKLISIINNPLEHYSYTLRTLGEINSCLPVAANFAAFNTASIENSVSYKIGRAITYIPRKIRQVWLCCFENGMRYTMQRIVFELKQLRR